MTPSWEQLFRTALAKHFAMGGAVGMDEGGEVPRFGGLGFGRALGRVETAQTPEQPGTTVQGPEGGVLSGLIGGIASRFGRPGGDGAPQPGYSNSPYAAGPEALPRDVVGAIKGARALTQYPGIIPDSPFVTNFGLAQRGGTGVDVMNTGLAGQNALAGQLEGIASGTGPSVAQPFFQGALDKSIKAAMATATSTPGVAPGAALRSGLEAGAGIAGAGASQAA